jgi:uncharacterized protein YicC (UPF0701 family)
MSFEADEDEIREAFERGDIEWILAAFRYKGKESSGSNAASNEDLLNDLIHAAGQNNEFDNTREVDYYRRLILERMKKRG